MADVQNTFYYSEHAPGIDRWPKPTTIATTPSSSCLSFLKRSLVSALVVFPLNAASIRCTVYISPSIFQQDLQCGIFKILSNAELTALLIRLFIRKG